MTHLKIATTHLEPSNGGKDQREIAGWIENDSRFIAYIDQANENGIPANEDDNERPSDEWLDNQNFHPEDLIAEACEVLNWNSVPDSLNLSMNFVINTLHHTVVAN